LARAEYRSSQKRLPRRTRFGGKRANTKSGAQSLASFRLQVLDEPLKRSLVRVVVFPAAEGGDDVLSYLVGRIDASVGIEQLQLLHVLGRYKRDWERQLLVFPVLRSRAWAISFHTKSWVRGNSSSLAARERFSLRAANWDRFCDKVVWESNAPIHRETDFELGGRRLGLADRPNARAKARRTARRIRRAHRGRRD
jgi:hypothetical protein